MEENKSVYSNNNSGAYSSNTGYNGNNGYNGYNGNNGFNGNSGYNPNAGYNSNPYNTPAYNQPFRASNEVKCPGKEITSMVFGIFALFYGVFGIIFCWYPIMAFVFGLFAIGMAIPAIVLHNSVMKIATVTTKKVQIGKKLGIAGIITGAVAMVLNVIVFFVIIMAFGSGAMYDILSSM